MVLVSVLDKSWACPLVLSKKKLFQSLHFPPPPHELKLADYSTNGSVRYPIIVTMLLHRHNNVFPRSALTSHIFVML